MRFNAILFALAAQSAESLFMKVEAGRMLEGMHGSPALPED